MMNTSGLILAVHVICTTLGYGGLICSNIWLAVMLPSTERRDALVHASLLMNRTFGPLLGIGVLLGFWVMKIMGFQVASPWLIIAYIVVALALVIQFAVAIPWQIRALRAISSGNASTSMPNPRTPSLVATAFIITFVLLILLMVTRPYSL